ncbi:MAG: DNA primase [Candidatus Levybacteria bacterium RIFCSPLOWO2_01_FULL_38_13]|nr:MAG: DNA primase [Candidatus Levybacteria bacterium RIFCSPHIGHO2_01_FULL_41_15]OGH35760.1 MAG: DNA primase [Candidatus Levybacteria bacterium RIFCSPLOWO2_01_FULL_38_13]
MDEVARVREKIDLPSLISEYIPLKKMGRNFKALCPFHNEKTPSFVVSPERQIWHCFGCGKGGDCYTFLMEYEKLEFIEALRILARKAGVELSETDFVKQGTSQKEKIYKLNNLSSDFYHFVLTKHPLGKKALSYLYKRKISPKLIETFKIGYSPGRGYALSKFLIEKKKYKPSDLLESGLSFSKGGRIVDFFRDRIMFPIYDHRDNLVAFSGRILREERESAPPLAGSKYVNTRDTLAYHKGSMFFGLNLAKEEIKKNSRAIIVEGEFDVISCYSQGIKNVVAIKGTALTENQVSLLSRFAEKVTLCLDQDEAGFEAIKRSLAALEKKDLTTTIIDLGTFKDPDEAIKKDPLFFKKALKKDIGIYDFLIDSFLNKFDRQTGEGKKKITGNLLPFISLIDNEIVKEHYLKLLSLRLEVTFDSLLKELEKVLRKEAQIPEFPIGKDKKTRKEILEEYLTSLIIQGKNPKEMAALVFKNLSDYSFDTPSYKKILENLTAYLARNEKFDEKKFAKTLPKEILPLFDICFLFSLPKIEDDKKYQEEVEKVLDELKVLNIRNKIRSISQNLNQRQPKERLVLQKELDSLLKLLRAVNSASKL